MTKRGWGGLVVAASFVAITMAGCTCSGGTSVAVDSGSDACQPADDPQRGHACASSTECPTGYTCRAAFSTATTCEISCTTATGACVCPPGLSCEIPAGMSSGICS